MQNQCVYLRINDGSVEGFLGVTPIKTLKKGSSFLTKFSKRVPGS